MAKNIGTLGKYDQRRLWTLIWIVHLFDLLFFFLSQKSNLSLERNSDTIQLKYFSNKRCKCILQLCKIAELFTSENRYTEARTTDDVIYLFWSSTVGFASRGGNKMAG